MAILDLGLSTSYSGSESLAGIRIYAGGTAPQAIYVVFSTESGTDWQETFDISCSFRYTTSAGSGVSEDGYCAWSDFYWSDIPAVACHPHQVPGNSRWWWAIGLGEIGEYLNGGTTPNPDWNVENMLFNDASYEFGDRKYDAINLQIHVKSHFVSGKTGLNGETVSNLAEANSLWIGYFPQYHLHDAVAKRDYLYIHYTSPGWSRNDDRFSIHSLSQSGSILKEPYQPGTYWGQVAGYDNGIGTIAIPYRWLTRMPTGPGLRVDIKMNASFRAVGMDFGELVGSLTVEDGTSCSSPTLTVISATQDKVEIRVGDSNDHETHYTTATCMLDGEVYDTDIASVENGGVFTIYYPPLGRAFGVSAIGTAGVDLTSKVVSITVDAIPADGRMFIAPIDTGFDQVEIIYNISEDWSFTPDTETVKFATRSYESVAFGSGGSSTGTVKFSIVNDERYGEMFQSREPYEYLMFARLCILRGPDGERRRVAVTNVNSSWDTYRQFRNISISMTEVV